MRPNGGGAISNAKDDVCKRNKVYRLHYPILQDTGEFDEEDFDIDDDNIFPILETAATGLKHLREGVRKGDTFFYERSLQKTLGKFIEPLKEMVAKKEPSHPVVLASG